MTNIFDIPFKKLILLMLITDTTVYTASPAYSIPVYRPQIGLPVWRYYRQPFWNLPIRNTYSFRPETFGNYRFQEPYRAVWKEADNGR